MVEIITSDKILFLLVFLMAINALISAVRSFRAKNKTISRILISWGVGALLMSALLLVNIVEVNPNIEALVTAVFAVWLVITTLQNVAALLNGN